MSCYFHIEIMFLVTLKLNVFVHFPSTNIKTENFYKVLNMKVTHYCSQSCGWIYFISLVILAKVSKLPSFFPLLLIHFFWTFISVSISSTPHCLRQLWSNDLSCFSLFLARVVCPSNLSVEINLLGVLQWVLLTTWWTSFSPWCSFSGSRNQT